MNDKSFMYEPHYDNWKAKNETDMWLIDKIIIIHLIIIMYEELKSILKIVQIIGIDILDINVNK